MPDPYREIVYGRLVDWPRRLARESPFFLELFASLPFPRILDLGSGSGEHARLFASHGFEVVGIDRSPTQVEQSRAASAGANVTFLAGDVSRAGEIVSGPFGAAICVGNTLPHLADDSTLERFARHARELVAPGGVLVVQVLNYDRIFSRSIRYLPPTIRPADDGEIVFLRILDPRPDGRTIVFTPSTLRYRSSGSPPVEVIASERLVLRGWRPAEIGSALERAGFSSRSLYGGFGKEPFDASESSDVIVVAR